MFDNIFQDKTVLITGHTGFKGSWLGIWLNELGANVIGYALEPYTQKDNFVLSNLQQYIIHNIGDIRDFSNLNSIFNKYEPEIIFHLAAQPIVRQSYIDPKETYDININGTINLLECCRSSDSVKVIINVTSDKCYENNETIWGFRETDPMGGYDPYSASKGCSEIITASYIRSFFNSDDFVKHGKCMASARAGNVIGGGDWQKDRIVPDCIRALLNQKSIEIRNPFARRPWQHVLEPLSGYLSLASKIYQNPRKYYGAYNFGPNFDSTITVGELVELIIKKWGYGNWIDISKEDYMHEAHLLYLETCKAQSELNWSPCWDIETTISKTVQWYKEFEYQNLYELCKEQIYSYYEDIERKHKFRTGKTIELSEPLENLQRVN